MRSLRLVRQAAAVVSITTLTIAASPAQELAVPGRTPGNPLVILGIPNTTALCKSLSQSDMGRKMLATPILPGISADDQATLEKQLGFSLNTADLLSNTIRGVDVYLLKNNEQLGFAVNVKFYDEATPGAILNQIKKDATQATGVAGGAAADTVVDTTAGGVRQLILPAFEICLAAEGSTLVWTNQKSSLESAFSNAGQAIFSSTYFKRYMDPLKDETSNAWMFGEVGKALPYLQDYFPANAKAYLQSIGSMVVSAKGDFAADHFKVSSFMHEEDMSVAQRRYTMTAPPPGEVMITNYFPEAAIIAFGTNHFDGLSILESVLESLDQAQESPVTSQQVEQQFQSSRALLGFDLKSDLIANLGPDFGVAIIPSERSDKADGDLPGDMVLITRIKDAERFKGVLDILDHSASDLAASTSPPQAAPPPKSGPNAETPAPTAAPPTLQQEDFEGAVIKYIKSPDGSPYSLSPGYCLSPDGFFLFALNKESIKRSLSVSKGGKSLFEQENLRKTREYLDPNRNAVLALQVKPLVALLESSQDKLISTMPEGSGASMAKFISAIKPLSSITVQSGYKSGGKKQEILLQF